MRFLKLFGRALGALTVVLSLGAVLAWLTTLDMMYGIPSIGIFFAAVFAGIVTFLEWLER